MTAEEDDMIGETLTCEVVAWTGEGVGWTVGVRSGLVRMWSGLSRMRT